MRRGLNVDIEIIYDHSHRADVAQALSWLRCSEDTIKQFESYFEGGMTAAAAKSYHEMAIIEECEENAYMTLANAQKNPSCSFVRTMASSKLWDARHWWYDRGFEAEETWFFQNWCGVVYQGRSDYLCYNNTYNAKSFRRWVGRWNGIYWYEWILWSNKCMCNIFICCNKNWCFTRCCHFAYQSIT